ncbi:hypothetical protein IWW45_004664 [Coemansia sp. RSA 485]|nr:hypothetical protein IWW45_004664 [Coemansia sp. RSA 485]
MKVEHSLRVPASPTSRQPQRLSQDTIVGPDTQVFGVSLDALMVSNGWYTLPRPVRECIAFINHHGLAAEGLFRRSPPSTALRSAKEGYNRNQAVDLSLAGVNVAAVLLKLFYRELPEPVFGGRNYEIIRALPASPRSETAGESSDVAMQMDSVRARYVEEVVLPSLKTEYRMLLCFTFALLSVVARNEAANRMNAYNLAIVWAPNFARSSNPMLDVSMCAVGPGAATVGSVVQIMVQMFDRVFSQELKAVLGSDADACVDKAAAVLEVVDRMNSGQLEGVRVSPPRLPPRKAVSPAARPTPPLPPRRATESIASMEGVEGSAVGDDEDGEEPQIFADAESESPSSLAVDPVAVAEAKSDAKDVVAESVETRSEQPGQLSPPKDDVDEAESKKSVESTDTKK